MMDDHYYLKCFSCAILIDILPGGTNGYTERPIEPKKVAIPRCYTELWINKNVDVIQDLRAEGRTWDSVNVIVAKLSGIKTKRHIVAKYSHLAGIE